MSVTIRHKCGRCKRETEEIEDYRNWDRFVITKEYQTVGFDYELCTSCMLALFEFLNDYNVS